MKIVLRGIVALSCLVMLLNQADSSEMEASNPDRSDLHISQAQVRFYEYVLNELRVTFLQAVAREAQVNQEEVARSCALFRETEHNLKNLRELSTNTYPLTGKPILFLQDILEQKSDGLSIESQFCREKLGVYYNYFSKMLKLDGISRPGGSVGKLLETLFFKGDALTDRQLRCFGFLVKEFCEELRVLGVSVDENFKIGLLTLLREASSDPHLFFPYPVFSKDLE